jgi:hypothetical protein
VAYLLVCSLLVAGLIRSTTLPAAASDDAAPLELASVLAPSGTQAAPKTGAADEATKARVSAAYNKLPLRFEENRGQVDTQVKYLSRGSASTLFLTKTEAVLMLHRGESKEQAAKAEAPSARRAAISAPPQASPMSVVRMKLHGANRSPRITGESEMSARTNYFIGNDPQQWRGDVAQYERVRYSEVYPGIDLLYYGQQQSLEYDFEVAPGADLRRIVLGFKGVRQMKIESGSGDLLLKTGSGEVRQHKPVVYQEEENGERREVEGRYVMKGKRKVGFKLGAYDRTKRLVIDPVLTYSTYLGGNVEDYGYAIAVDAVGNAYVTGEARYSDFPLLNQYQTFQGGFFGDAFVTRLNTNLSGTASLVYSTYLGGSDNDNGSGIAVDSSGNVYVTGNTESTNFPLLNQYQTFQGGQYGDAFVTKLNTNLSGTASLVYSTYLGGSGDDGGSGIAVDSIGNAYVTGSTSSTNFPTLNQYQTDQSGTDVFATRLNTNLSGAAALVYSTYLGGNGTDEGNAIAVDGAGNAYVTGRTSSSNFPLLNQYQTIVQSGRDAFVTKLNTNLSGTVSLLYSTYLGGNSSDDSGNGIAVDAAGNAYVTGYTSSSNFPTFNPYQATFHGGFADVFVTRLNTNLSGTASLVYSTYLGGNSSDEGNAIAIDGAGNAYVTGSTESTNFPIRNQYQTFQGGIYDAFVTKLNTNLSGTASLVYSTYLGGNIDDLGHGIAVDSSGNFYVAGYTSSTNFPIRNQYQADQGGDDAFVARLTEPPSIPPPGDFDADRKTDLALWHPTSGDWQIIRSSNNSTLIQPWGMGGLGDKPVPGDYDGDGKADIAVWRPSDTAWYILQSSNNTLRADQWGLNGDKPAPADFDGDHKTDLVVYRPSEGTWYVLQSSNNSVRVIRWGSSEDKPVPADYDGDQKADAAVFRPSTSVWYILRSTNTGFPGQQWGLNGDQPVAGDYDGDGKADIAVWRPSDGNWYVLRSSSIGGLYAVHCGESGDMPVPGDYDADGKIDTAVWRPTTGTWYILRSSDGALIQQQFGSSGDLPVPAAYLPE